jgi:hypothetical protein
MYNIYNMFFSLIKWVLISLTLIFLVHHLYMYLTNILTVPKIKDLVNKPTQQYNDIYETLSKSGENTMSNSSNSNSNNNSDSKISLSSNTMTNELSSFLNDLKKTKVTTNTFASNNDVGGYTPF